MKVYFNKKGCYDVRSNSLKFISIARAPQSSIIFELILMTIIGVLAHYVASVGTTYYLTAASILISAALIAAEKSRPYE